jgi:hypothetical protein
MKKAEKNIASLSTGVIVAFAIVFSQLFCFQAESHSKKEAKTEQQQKENPEDDVYISVPSTSLPSTAHVELNPNVFFLFEVLSEREVSEVTQPTFSLPTGQFFRKIFGVTISPNAP